ncbi:hypothetical protein JX266_005047 [Neoarthrinium moseri]|nr:hypothetical protein JX266_005047 [Neoarthrinium moseri]
MTKIIAPIYKQLERANDCIQELETKYKALQHQYLQVATRLARYEKLPNLSRTTTRADSPKNSDELNLPSYARGTLSSQRRSGQMPDEASIRARRETFLESGKIRIYENYKLAKVQDTNVYDGWQITPHFQMETISSFSKTIRLDNKRRSRRDHTGRAKTSTETSNEETLWPTSAKTNTKELNPRDDDRYVPWMASIKEKSGYNEDQWLHQMPAGKVFIPSKYGYDLLNRGLDTAKQLFYEISKHHFPHCIHRNNLEGAHEVRFGFRELNSILGGDRDTPRPFLAIHGNRWSFVNEALYSIVDLRNCVAHFNGAQYYDMVRYDRLLKNVHLFAIVVKDEVKAFEMRALRDELLAYAQQTFDEIVEREWLASLPFATPWPIHHQKLFKHLGYCSSIDEYPPVILRAMGTWEGKKSVLEEGEGRNESEVT